MYIKKFGLFETSSKRTSCNLEIVNLNEYSKNFYTKLSSENQSFKKNNWAKQTKDSPEIQTLFQRRITSSQELEALENSIKDCFESLNKENTLTWKNFLEPVKKYFLKNKGDKIHFKTLNGGMSIEHD